MSSTIEINKICEWCGKEFIAHKSSTRFCSHRCSGLSYKASKREKHVREQNQRTSELKTTEIISSLNYFTPTEYIMTMIKEFSNLTHQEKVTLSKELIFQYRELCIHLSHIEGNLTQTTNRINEHRANGVLLPPDIENEVLPRLIELRSLCTSLKSQLLKITNNHCIWS